ncbi:MAG: hypothetical protein QM733_21270 [Ilumatobacteraceae bacterium]
MSTPSTTAAVAVEAGAVLAAPLRNKIRRAVILIPVGVTHA